MKLVLIVEINQSVKMNHLDVVVITKPSVTIKTVVIVDVKIVNSVVVKMEKLLKPVKPDLIVDVNTVNSDVVLIKSLQNQNQESVNVLLCNMDVVQMDHL